MIFKHYKEATGGEQLSDELNALCLIIWGIRNSTSWALFQFWKQSCFEDSWRPFQRPGCGSWLKDRVHWFDATSVWALAAAMTPFVPAQTPGRASTWHLPCLYYELAKPVFAGIDFCQYFLNMLQNPWIFLQCFPWTVSFSLLLLHIVRRLDGTSSNKNFHDIYI